MDTNLASPMRIRVPFDDDTIAHLHAGDTLLLTGTVLGARDAAHARLVKTLAEGQPLPVVLKDQVIYYVGPAPAKPGMAVGPAGPTTSGRMDSFTPALLAQGVKGLIGKGTRTDEVKGALVWYHAVYLVTFGGAAALLARQIKSSRVVAYPELGPEAIYEFVFEDFPAVVANDVYGQDAYLNGRAAYALPRSLQEKI